MIRSINSGALVRKPSRRADAAQLRERREMARGGGDKAGPLVSLTERGREREREAGREENGERGSMGRKMGQRDMGQL